MILSKKLVKKLVGIQVAAVMCIASLGGTTANAATSDSYTSATELGGDKAYWRLTIGSNPDVGSGWSNASIAFAKGGDLVINAQYFYSANRNKYYTEGSIANCYTSKVVVMKSSVPGAVNIGAKTKGASYVKYKDGKLTLGRTLKVGTPPTSTKGYTER